MNDYKPKMRTTCVRTFCRALMYSKRALRVVGSVAYDEEGDKRIILYFKSKK